MDCLIRFVWLTGLIWLIWLIWQGWLVDWVDWWIYVFDWLIGGLIGFVSADWRIDRLMACWDDGLIDWWFDRLNDWWVDGLILFSDWLIYLLIKRLVGWLICVVGWLSWLTEFFVWLYCIFWVGWFDWSDWVACFDWLA